MDIRQWDPSPATATRYRNRPRLHPAGPVHGTGQGPGTGGPPGTGVVATLPQARGAAARSGRASSSPVRMVKPGARTSSRVAGPGARLARPGGLAPPVTALAASRAPSHATSGGS
jgi:hypothetical protein